MKLVSKFFWVTVIGLAILAAVNSVLFVDETELVVVTRFGEIVNVYDHVSENSYDSKNDNNSKNDQSQQNDRGLHFKVPWYAVRRFDRRLQVYDPPSREMLTKSHGQENVSVVGTNLMVDCYVCWRIPSTEQFISESEEQAFHDRPVVKFLKSVRSMEGAEARLENLVLSKLQNEIAQIQLPDLLQVSEPGTTITQDSKLRMIGNRVASSLQSLAKESGIEIVDVQIKRMNLPDENRSAVYARQRSERQRIATKYRSEGEAEATRLKSQADRLRDTILQQAKAEGQRIRGQGEAEAADIYAAAYGRDPQFFQLLRTLQAYEKILGEQTTLVLSSSSKIFELLSQGLPPIPKHLKRPSSEPPNTQQNTTTTAQELPQPEQPSQEVPKVTVPEQSTEATIPDSVPTVGGSE